MTLTYLTLACYGVDGLNLNDNVDYVYLDLSVSSNDTFGEKVPISIPNATARKINITIRKVIFEDDSNWENRNSTELRPVLSAVPASSLKELQDVYEWKTGFSFLPIEQNDYWICRCNSINAPANQECFSCKTNKKLQFDQIDHKYLNNALLEYQQHLEQSKMEAKKQSDLAKTVQNKKRFIFVSVTVALLIIIAIANHNNIDSRELMLARRNAYHMIENDWRADLELTLASYNEEDSEENKKYMNEYYEIVRIRDEHKLKYKAYAAQLNEKELAELKRYIDKIKASYPTLRDREY